MAFCPKCGNQIPDDANFCNSCGSFTNAQTSANENVAYNANNVNYNNNQGAYAMYRTPVKTNRSLLAYIVLTIITCGIYSYFFIYDMAKDVNQMCAEDGDKVGGLGAYILLSFLTCGIYSIYWLYKVQNRLNAAGPRYGVMIPENGTNVVVWYLVGMFLCFIGIFVSMNIVISSANKVGTAYNAKYFYNQQTM